MELIRSYVSMCARMLPEVHCFTSDSARTQLLVTRARAHTIPVSFKRAGTLAQDNLKWKQNHDDQKMMPRALIPVYPTEKFSLAKTKILLQCILIGRYLPYLSDTFFFFCLF